MLKLAPFGTDHVFLAKKAKAKYHLFMPRRSRIIIPGVPLHLIQRGNNRQPCFYSDEDYGFYLDWLQEYSRDTGCSVHAYVLMTNHVHILLTPADADSAGMLMKRLKRIGDRPEWR